MSSRPQGRGITTSSISCVQLPARRGGATGHWVRGRELGEGQGDWVRGGGTG